MMQGGAPFGSTVDVVLADPRQLMCEGIQTMLHQRSGARVVAVARSKEELLETLAIRMPDVVLLNPRLGAPGGAALVRELRRTIPQLSVLALASDASNDDPVALLRAGARGYISRAHDLDDLLAALIKVGLGGLYVDSELSERLAAEIITGSSTNSFAQLSPREAEVFHYLAQGHTVSHIAQVLQLSVKTVSTHKGRMMERLGLGSLSELIQYAISNDLMGRGAQAGAAREAGAPEEEPEPAAPPVPGLELARLG